MEVGCPRRNLGPGELKQGVVEAVVDRVGSGMGKQMWKLGVVETGDRLWRFGSNYEMKLEWSVQRGEPLGGTVDAIFFDGKGPPPKHPMWKRKGLKLVCWSQGNSSCGPPPMKTWTSFRRTWNHSELGGVTNLNIVISGAVKHPLVFCYRKPVGISSSTMSQVLSRKHFGVSCPAPSGNDTHLSREVLDWKLRENKFALPCVLSKGTGFVSRNLTPTELLMSLDVPQRVMRGATKSELKTWVTSVKIPFKIRSELIWSLSRSLDEPRLSQNDDPILESESGVDEEVSKISQSADESKRSKPRSKSEV